MMTRATKEKLFQIEAGRTLRCLLMRSGFLLVIIFATSVEYAYAQIEVFKPRHVWRVQGYVTNTSGKSIAGAEVILARAESVVFKTKTDGSGKFKFDHAAGQYWLRVMAPHYSTAARDVIIGADLTALFHGSTFYVMLGQDSCMDECSPIYTSKKKFDHAVRWNTGHYY
jgi:hypothetical protein